VPSLKRGSSGILIEAGVKKILVDVGLGTLHKLLQLGITQSEIDIICCTHLHPDHTCELVPFLFACKYAEKKREKDLLILGGEGFIRFFHSLSELYQGWLSPEIFQLEVKELVHSTCSVDGMVITATPVKHSLESIAFKLTESGKSVVISGDTGYCREIVGFAQGSDLLILECSSPNFFETDTHLNPSSAGKIAVESGCKRLLLTHFYPVCGQHDIASECAEIFKGELLLAEDLMSVEVG
jgi:ribonuclease BN (tRNA processing enzyme)